MGAMLNCRGTLGLMSWPGTPISPDDFADAVQTIENPDHREPDSRPGRERLFRRGGPDRWLRVVVEFAGDFDHVVTVFPQTVDPRPSRSR